MGCAPTKEAPLKVSSPSAKVAPIITLIDKKAVAKASIIDSIKRTDLILFEKTMHQYELSPAELIGPADQQKTILHLIAEANFAEAMTLAIEFAQAQSPDKVAQILNSKDANGNTPAIACCIFDCGETLDILMKSGFVNLTVKNNAGQNALAAAQDNDSSCVNVLSSNTLSNTRDTFKTPAPPSMNASLQVNSPKIAGNSLRNSLLKDEAASPSSRPRGSLQLRSVASMTKEIKLPADSRLYQVITELENNEFIDEEFAHDSDGVANEESFPLIAEHFGEINWLKPSQLPGLESQEIALFEGIDIANVSTSPLIGSELYSALAIMTEYPQRLLKVFTTREVNKQGAYSVKFLVSGIPIEILIDQYVPCIAGTSQPLFSRPPANEIWFMLLEKAFAKLYGSYYELTHLTVTDALETMTGMPTAQIPLKDAEPDQVWSLLQECDKKNLIYCAGNNHITEQKTNKIFTIVRLYENEEYKIVKLRNHFNDFAWNGAFSDGSEKWTKELKEEIGHYDGEKNCFYMKLNEFMKQFDFLTVCHYNEGWTRTGKEVSISHKKALFFELELEREMEIVLSVHQKLPRFVEEEGYELSPVEILVGEILDDGDTIKKVASGEKDAFEGKATTFASENIKMRLSEGKYVVRVKVRWADEAKHDLTINAFSQYPLGFKRVSSKEYPDFLERVYLNTGSRSDDKYQLGNRCEFGSSWCGSHLWLYGVNRGTKTWNLEINFKKLENLKLCKKYRISDTVIKLTIPPKGEGVGFVKRINTHPMELNWGFNQSWS